MEPRGSCGQPSGSLSVECCPTTSTLRMVVGFDRQTGRGVEHSHGAAGRRPYSAPAPRPPKAARPPTTTRPSTASIEPGRPRGMDEGPWDPGWEPRGIRSPLSPPHGRWTRSSCTHFRCIALALLPLDTKGWVRTGLDRPNERVGPWSVGTRGSRTSMVPTLHDPNRWYGLLV